MAATDRKPGTLPQSAQVTVIDPDLQRELRSLVMHDEESSQEKQQQQMLLLEEEEKKKQFGMKSSILVLSDGENDYELKGYDVDDEELIQELNKDVSKVDNDLREVNQLIREMGEHIAAQGDGVKNAEKDVEKADEEVEAGLEELAEAQRIKSSTRTKKAMIAGASTGALTGAVAGAFLGPVGGAAGAAVGAAVGAGLGVGAGYGVGQAVDQTRQADQLEMELQQGKFFVPFESVTLCLDCGSSFGAFRHPHHCHTCGGVFCRDCLEKKRISYVKVSRKVKARVCKICLKNYPASSELFDAGCEAHSQQTSSES